MVPLLIYYADTEKLFDYHEIMELKTEYEEMTGQAMAIPHQLKNYLIWFAF